MDLWIRSQDKTRLSRITDIYVVGYDDDWAIDGYCINEVDDFDLGIYSSKERALEVLDEIQIEVEQYLGTLAQIVYEMPKE